jgi:hypothetical protein
VVRLSEVDPERLYTPGEVAGMFRVDPKTVVRWIKRGKFDNAYERTAGGHHRIYGFGVQRHVRRRQAEEADRRATVAAGDD